MGFIAYVLLLIMLLEIYTYVENIELINSILYSDFTVGIMFFDNCFNCIISFRIYF
jgi:hypothetical protein